MIDADDESMKCMCGFWLTKHKQNLYSVKQRSAVYRTIMIANKCSIAVLFIGYLCKIYSTLVK